jgi:D-xylose transport system ATP-binding protein
MPPTLDRAPRPRIGGYPRRGEGLAAAGAVVDPDVAARAVRDRFRMALLEREPRPVTAPPAESGPLLECRGVCKRFGAVEALIDVDFEVYPGEVVALVGDNGAGKSTLIKAISGTQPADRGSFRFDGRDVTIRTPTDANKLGIETVYQDLALCDNLDTVANLFLGRELGAPAHAPGAVKVLAESDMEQLAGRRLDDLGVTTIESLRGRVGTLSGGQRQAVAVAKATMWDAKLVILDEPTAALGVAQTAQVLDLIRRLREKGLGVVVITHNIDVVFEVADRIVVLRVGRRVATFDQRETTPQQVVSAIVGVEEA